MTTRGEQERRAGVPQVVQAHRRGEGQAQPLGAPQPERQGCHPQGVQPVGASRLQQSAGLLDGQRGDLSSWRSRWPDQRGHVALRQAFPDRLRQHGPEVVHGAGASPSISLA